MRLHDTGLLRSEVAAVSDRGRCRSSNQDRVLVNQRLGLYLVADGLGGHKAGEVAARMAGETVEHAVSAEPGLSGQQLARALLHAHDRVRAAARAVPAWRGMATTVTALLLRERRAVVAHVGDSRAYLWRGGQLRQLTRDHSLVQHFLDLGLLSPEQAREHPQRHTLLAAVGGSRRPEVQLLEQPLEPCDELLLCSDGLSSMLSDTAIAAQLRRGPSAPQAAAEALVAEANASGGEDNISVLLLRLLEPATLVGGPDPAGAAEADLGRPLPS